MKRKIKLTYIFTHHIRWVQFEWVAKYSDRSLFEIDYLILNQDDPMIDFLKENNIPYKTTCFNDYKNTPEVVKFIYDHLVANQTDIVHTRWFAGQIAFVPLLQIGLGINLAIALVFGLAAILFPEPIFNIFTNHSELIGEIKVYLPWIILVVVGSGFAYILDGYFAGLGEGVVIRNTYLISGSLGFISLALANFYFHSNHFLWLSLFIFMLSCAVTLGLQIPMTLPANDRSSSKLVL